MSAQPPVPYVSPTELREDKRPQLLPIFITFSILPLFAVALRVLARRLKRTDLWWDDYLLLSASVRSDLTISNGIKFKEANRYPRSSSLFN